MGNVPVSMMLAARPRLRSAVQATNDQRWDMLNLACNEEELLIPDASELRISGVTRTIDTVTRLDGKPESPVVWILGDDAASQLPGWVRYGELREKTSFFLFRRTGTDLTKLQSDFEIVAEPLALAKKSGRLYVSDYQTLSISATEIREHCAEGSVPKVLLHRGVWDYIIQHNLYAE